MKMTKEQKQLTVIVVGLVVIAVVLFFNLRKKEEKSGNSVSEETSVPAGEKATPETAESRPSVSPDIRRKQEAALAKPYGRDPFTLPSREPEIVAPKVVAPKVADPELAPISLSLRAISIREGAAPMAVINNSIARVGDKIGDVEIVGIYKDHVLLKRGGRKYKLKLKE